MSLWYCVYDVVDNEHLKLTISGVINRPVHSI